MEENIKEITLENEECSSFLDELETLQSIYINETDIQKHESITTVSIDLHPATADNFHEQYVKMTLILNVKEGYPKIIPEIVIRNPRGLSDEKLNSITEDLIEVAENKKGSSMLFEIIEAAKDHITAENRPCEECAICLYGFHEEDVFTKTECYHYFHSHCLARYSRNFSLNEEESTSEEENNTNQLLCPVCRLPIHFEESEEIYPLPKSGDEQFELTDSILDLQKKMSELYSKQVEKGGIIDVEAEKNKFLLEIAHVPSVTEISHTCKPEDSDEKTTDVVDVSSIPACVSPGENERKEHSPHSGTLKSGKDGEKSVKSNVEDTKNSKSGEEKRTYKELRGERMNRDKNYNREKNERYNTTRGNNKYGNHYANDRNGYHKNNRYNERRNNWYEREPQNSRYDNDRRNDRHRSDGKNERYGNDRYNNEMRNGRYRNDKYNSDLRNDMYGGDRRNDRYDRRFDKYDQRFVRHEDRQHNRFERQNFQDNFKNGSFHRRNRNQNNYTQDDDANHFSTERFDHTDSPNNENPASCDTEEPDGNDRGRSVNHEIDKQDDWGNDDTEEYKNDKPRDFENLHDYNKDRVEEYKNDKNFKSNERNYQPRNRRNERQDRRLNGNFSDVRYNNKKENRFDSYRGNYRQNGSRTEFHDYERRNSRFPRGRGNRYHQNDRNNMNAKSEEREIRSENYNVCPEEEDVSISPEINQDENVANSVCVCDSETSQFVESIKTNNSIRDEENIISNNALASETSNNRKDSFPGKNYVTNRTNKENYKKWSYGHNTNYPRGKKFNSSNAYQKNAGFHSQLKHSESQDSENYNLDCDDVNIGKTDDVGKDNTSYNEVSGLRNTKNNGVDVDDSQSFRKNYRRIHSSNNKRGQPNSYRNYAEEDSRGEEEFQQEPHTYNNQKDSPKYTPRTSNRRYQQRKYKEDNYEKSSNVQNTSTVEAKNDLKKKENSVHKNIPVEESASPTVCKASDVKNSVPTSNFLPPLSSVAPPPGFQNPSRKIVYGLAAANPPPGFHRS